MDGYCKNQKRTPLYASLYPLATLVELLSIARNCILPLNLKQSALHHKSVLHAPYYSLYTQSTTIPAQLYKGKCLGQMPILEQDEVPISFDLLWDLR